MNLIENPDIPESQFPKEILMALLYDHSSQRNIIWATDDYIHLGLNYYFHMPIEVPLITGENEGICLGLPFNVGLYPGV